jgi:pilus assembly protein CpaB
MSSRKIILLVLAFLIGVGTFIAFRSAQTPPPAVQAPVVQTTEILAASRDLPTGTILKEMDMKWISWAQSAENPKLYIKGKTDMSALTGAVVREGLRADEPILAGRVVQPHEQGFLAAVLTPGMRAVSVTLTPSAEVAGFIFPGDHVDVVMTHSFVVKQNKNNPDTTERRLSETVITDARVLALDQKSDNQSTDPKVAQLATLEVTPKQAEKLILAADMGSSTGGSHGSLSLVLRSLATTENADGEKIPAASANLEPSLTMDSDISPVFSRVTHLQNVQVMRGKETTETTFEKK